MEGFVIFSLGRSGSTLLTSLLNSHPAIHCDGEIFNRTHGPQWRRTLGPVLARCPIPYVHLRKFIVQHTEPSSAYGFKLFLAHARKPEQLIPQLHGLGWHILYLERLSIFALTVSALVARHTHRYHGIRGQSEPDLAPFSIAPDHFMEILRNRERSAVRCREIAARTPHLRLTYEHDLAPLERWHTTVVRVCTHIGIAPPVEPVATQLQMPWSHPYSELITNYAELVETARQNGCDA